MPSSVRRMLRSISSGRRHSEGDGLSASQDDGGTIDPTSSSRSRRSVSAPRKLLAIPLPGSHGSIERLFHREGRGRKVTGDEPWGVADDAAAFDMTAATAMAAAGTQPPLTPRTEAAAVSHLKLGEKIPAFECEGEDPSGRVVCRFSAARPTGRFTLLCLFSGGYDFMRCKPRMAKMEELWRCYAAQDNCQFLAISYLQTAAEVRAFRMGLGASLTMPVAPDPEGRIFDLFGNTTVPQFYLLNGEYRIVQQSMGFVSNKLLTHMNQLNEDDNGDYYSEVLLTGNRDRPSPAFPKPTGPSQCGLAAAGAFPTPLVAHGA